MLRTLMFGAMPLLVVASALATGGPEDVSPFKSCAKRTPPPGVSLTPTSPTQFEVLPGLSYGVSITVNVTNTGTATDTFDLSLSGWAIPAGWPVQPSSVTLQPGQSSPAGAFAAVGSDVMPGTIATVSIDVASQTAPQVTASVIFTLYVLHPPATLQANQNGPGSPVMLTGTNLFGGAFNGHVYHAIFSADICGLPGTGPYLGLCANDLNVLLVQYYAPLGTLPFHFIGTGSFGYMMLGSYAVPPGLTLDFIVIYPTLAVFPGAPPYAAGPVVRYTVQ